MSSLVEEKQDKPDKILGEILGQKMAGMLYSEDKALRSKGYK